MRLFSGRVRNGADIAITSWLSRVGTKSYDVSHEVRTGRPPLERSAWAGSEGAARPALVRAATSAGTAMRNQVYRVSDNLLLLAQCTSTCVVVLDGKAVAMPNAALVRPLVIPTETALTAAVDEPRPPQSACGGQGEGLAASPPRIP